ncbi:DUF3040 domain-containing protein [Amycolatopsis sp.]|uniref:DUF3040 domain-containing protein n=1 Tax=Amycolatopsis sp. TaxID=37632 RepID=UPI002B7ABD30|nr:DUF3040 domain-containing protein [Amycolatopsis sp.]HVV12044.1 DUF3040 domain-containing protein [Amycolatopsis sp.]
MGETRRLAEIQQRLARDDPGLARVLATGRPSASAGFVVVLGSVLASFAAGLLLALGAHFAPPVVLAVGALFVVVVPAILLARRFRAR